MISLLKCEMRLMLVGDVFVSFTYNENAHTELRDVKYKCY